MTSARVQAEHLATLLRREHGALADFIGELAEFDRQRSWAELGHSGLFTFLHRELGLSRAAAFHRKVAATLVQSYPEVLAALRDGRLCLSAVVEVARVIHPANASDVLPRFFHCSRREAKAVSAAIVPEAAPPERDMVTSLRAEAPAHPAYRTVDHHPAAGSTAPDTAPSCEAAAADPAIGDGAGWAGGSAAAAASHAVEKDGPADGATPPISAATVRPLLPPSHPAPSNPTVADPAAALPSLQLPLAPRDEAVPLTAELRRLHITVSTRFLDKLEAAKVALSHSHPSGRAEEVLEAALDLLLARDAKRKGLVKNPRPDDRSEGPPERGVEREDRDAGADAELNEQARAGRSAAAEADAPAGTASTYIPASVKRKVWRRDRGRCQWPMQAGGICGSRIRIEFDHIQPRALGGPSTEENLRLLCKFHNDRAARRAFGDAWMDRFTRGAVSFAREAAG